MEVASSFEISQGIFLKFVGLIYFFAFWSLLLQAKGLYGSQGIHPIQAYLDTIEAQAGKKLYGRLPTLFWYGASDRCLMVVIWAGIGSSLLVMLGVFPALFLFFLWICYFSFYSVGSIFLSFQWDTLLLEVGFLAIFFGIQSPPPILFVYLLWVLLFRFIFSSGLTKLIYGSKEWRDLTAMDVHYETQPLPTILGYYMHQQPKFFAKLSVVGVYFFEILLPLFIFTPEKTRFIVCCGLIFFQILIILTGNYAFFNLLAVALCIPPIPDSYLFGLEGLAWFLPVVSGNIVTEIFLSVFAVFFMILNALELATVFVPSRKIYSLLHPFHLCDVLHSYGLFIHMTTVRDEIIIEGSEDEEHWEAYEFKWKPGNLYQAPRLVAPHQPRLDWQMWFAALGQYRQNRWLMTFFYRLLEGSEDVLRLLKVNPFPHHPPKYIRAVRYRYHFTDLKTKRETGQWWTRIYLGKYSPIMTLASKEEE